MCYNMIINYNLGVDYENYRKSGSWQDRFWKK